MQLWKETEQIEKQRIVNTHRDWVAFHGEVNYGEVIGSKAAVEKNRFFHRNSVCDHGYTHPIRQSFIANYGLLGICN